MSADAEGRASAVGVTARPGVSGPDGNVDGNGDGTRAVAAAPRGPGASRTSGTHGPREALNVVALRGTHAFPGPGSGTVTGPGPGPKRDTSPAPTPGTAHRPGRLLGGVAWAVLLLGLWLWGRDLADEVAAQLATTGDVAAAGRPLGRQAPPHAHAPVRAAATARPVRITLDALGVREAGITGSGLDGDGLLTPPPYTSPQPVGWYAGGPQPGEPGAALLVARADALRGPGAQRAGFHRLSRLKPGERVDIQRADGSTARFTIEDVQLYDRHRFDPRRAYAAHDRGRSELRLITEDNSPAGATGRPGGGETAHVIVVVSAYLTSYQEPPHTPGGD
ncbi:sortase domain-bontaining protein [Streptomyces sp. NPDC127097]|uniref:sortase domain-containing protein n=1 Tax=Streptomyces sp. NPDC127097 TaxID=3347136 RepID=UPI0036556DEB